MDKVVGGCATAIAGLAGVAFLVMLGMLVGPLIGALAGWVVGWFFGETILYVLGQLGLHDVAMWQLGMALGFVGGFFRATLTTNAKAS